jgi:molecular chaperone GrpE
VAESDTAEQLSAEIEGVEEATRRGIQGQSEYKDSWMRSQAEFQNYKKRLERDNELRYVSMKGDIVKKVLPVLDDLERALQNRPADDAWANGIELIARKLQNVLDSEGIKRIEARDWSSTRTSTKRSHMNPADGVKSGFVIAVVQNGYMLGERVIFALVRVALVRALRSNNL